jgi:hypothetical protein
LGYWAKSREVQLLPLGKIENLKAEDIIVVTSSGDFARISRLKKRYPNVRIVFDAVDGIHGEVSQSHDLLRGLAYCFSGRV